MTWFRPDPVSHLVDGCSEELGRGAFSIVKLAINKATGAKVAVKVIDKTKMSEQYKKNLQMETDILRKGSVSFVAEISFCAHGLA